MKKILSVIVLLLMLFSLAACAGGGENPTQPTQTKEIVDENGNKTRSEVYSKGKLEWYTLYEYYENGTLKKQSTYKVHKEKDILASSAEYKYFENGKISWDEKYSYDEDTGAFGAHSVSENYESGKLKFSRYYNAAGNTMNVTGFTESGNAIYAEHWNYDEKGTFTGRRVSEHSEAGLFLKEENYDAANKLESYKQYSYHGNNQMKEQLHCKGDGTVLYKALTDESGKATYEETATLRGDGTVSRREIIEYGAESKTQTQKKYDASGSVTETEIIVTGKDGHPVREEKYDAKGTLVYYRDATRLVESIYENGVFAGKQETEFFSDGTMKKSETTDALGRLTDYQEFFSTGEHKKQESKGYDKNGQVVSYSYSENNEDGNLVYREQYELDENGNYKEKYVARYDKNQNVIYSERIENGVLVYRSSAEYFENGDCKKEESYSHREIDIEYNLREYDEKGREIYREFATTILASNRTDKEIRKTEYDSKDRVVREERSTETVFPDRSEKGTEVNIYTYNANGNIAKQETIFTASNGHYEHKVSEYYENGKIKMYCQYDRQGKLIEKRAYDVNGNRIPG